MQKNTLYVIGLFFFLYSGALWAEAKKAAPSPTPEPTTIEEPLPGPEGAPVATTPAYAGSHKIENWYWGFDLGIIFPSYGGAYKSASDSLKALSGVSRVPLELGLGFYWPLSNGEFTLGGSFRSLQDRYSTTTESLTFHQFLLTFTGAWFFSTVPYEGFYLRGDAGVGTISLNYTGPSLSLTSQSKSGPTVALTAGYGLPLSEETRLVFQTFFSFFHADSESFSTFGITVGPVF